MAPGANIGDNAAIFEATHGTAPKHAGLNKINPGSVILSGVMMLEYFGWDEAANLITNGLSKAIEQKKVTYDLARLMEPKVEPLSCSCFAEEIVFGEEEVTTGASNDLQQVANVARQMITKFGMSDKIGPVALGQSQGGMFLGRDMSSTRDFSEDTAATIDVEVSELVDVAYKRATKVLSDNRTVLDEMAQMLIERETIDTEDIQDLLNRSEVKVANYI